MLLDTGIVIITLFTALAMATGLAGCVLPVIPGPSLIWLGGLVYGLLTGFGFVGWTAMALMTVLLVVGSAAPYVLPHLTGRKTGASRRALLAGVVLGIVGFLIALALIWEGAKWLFGDPWHLDAIGYEHQFESGFALSSTLGLTGGLGGGRICFPPDGCSPQFFEDVTHYWGPQGRVQLAYWF